MDQIKVVANLCEDDFEVTELPEIGQVRIKIHNVPGDMGPDMLLPYAAVRYLANKLNKVLPENK